MSSLPVVSRPDGRSIVGLDLIRFAAAAYVVLYHLGHRAWAPPVDRASIRQLVPDAPAFPELEFLAWPGWIGVQVFFVISGFVIARSAEGSSPFRFLKSRVVRLAPSVWICATLTLLGLLALRRPEAGAITTYVQTLALPLFPQGPWVDSVYWTLVVELVFYSLVLVLLALDRFRHVDWFAAALALVSGGSWLLNGAFGVGDWFLTTWPAQVLMIRYGCFFAAGLLLWLLFYKGLTLPRVALLALSLAGGLWEIVAQTQENAAIIGRALPAHVAQAVFLLGVAAIVISVACNRTLTRWCGSTATGVIPLLGLMTYPLYLVHNVVGVIMLRAMVDRGVDRYLALATSAALMVLVAFLICRRAEPAFAAPLKATFAKLGRWLEDSRTLRRLLLTKTQSVAPSARVLARASN